MPATLDLDELRSHIGRAQTSTDVIHAGPANLLRLALGRSEPEYPEGDVLPPAWLALYFLPRVASDALRPDGSPRDTGVVPPLTLPRRMFAGERVRLHAAVRIGETLRRETRLADISVKHGSTGTLVFATVTSRVYGPNGLAIEEERHTVFREEVKAGERNQAPRRESPPSDAPWRRRVTPDPVLLFRFSALTFNSHRIHYDRTWAMQVEGYPGLVVHGPLRSEEHTSELQSPYDLVCRLLLEKKKIFERRQNITTGGRTNNTTITIVHLISRHAFYY